MSDELRKAEAEWLVNKMNQSGLSNAELLDRLKDKGWTGQPNNISLWRNAKMPIPDRVVPLIAEIFGDSSDGRSWHDDVVAIFAKRQPFLVPYLRSPHQTSAVQPKLSAPVSASARRKLVYIPRAGALQGVRHVPYKDADGYYVAGTSRFQADKQTFRTFADLAAALTSNKNLCVRVVAEGVPGAKPSLVRQDSLVWE